MSERPTPEHELEYQDVRTLYAQIRTLFDKFQRHKGDVESHKIKDAIELIKPVLDLPEGETAWLSLFREIRGTTHLFRISRITQHESREGERLAMKAGITTYSFLAFNSASLTSIHSSKWSEKKQLGVDTVPTEEYGVLLDVRMSRPAVYETSASAPILQQDLPEIQGMLADWR